MYKAPNNLSDLSSLSDRAKRSLREMICHGEIRSGQRLDQRSLAKQLKLTTAPLREALSSLEGEGIVVRQPGLGIFCRAYTVDEIDELIDIRGALEGLAARLAVNRITKHQLDELYQIAHELAKPASAKTGTEFAEKHIRFHSLIAEASGSQQLISMLDRNRLIRQVLYNIVMQYWTVEPQDHTPLVDAIASGNPQHAEKVMRDHIAPKYVERLKILRKLYGDGPILKK